MEYRTLGRTELSVSLVSLGSGGPSQLGQNTGVPESEVHTLLHTALDMGINLIDTATGYGKSEEILGRALKTVDRNRYYIATKTRPVRENHILSASELTHQVETSLKRLQLETIDIFQFHGVQRNEYDGVRDSLVSTAQKLKSQGKIRFIGITEMYFRDGDHQVLQRAVKDDLFDTVMVGYNLLNQTAEKTVFPLCDTHKVGILIMIAVRRALSRIQVLEKTVADLKDKGVISRDELPDKNPLGWLVKDGTESVTAAAYKFAAAPKAVSTVITGTSKLSHLKSNVNAILGPPLPAEDITRLNNVFGHISESLGN
ncbi:aldo/keto reductase [Candidatus Poribacteria bacterium]|nr:aldo/keto reductase [Candidatus Poribacteria bacterium]